MQDNEAIRGVIAAEDARIGAILAHDVDALEHLLADDLHYVHASARIDSKSTFLASLRSGRVKYHQGTLSDLAVEIRGEAAVVTGQVKWETTVENGDRIVTARFVNVWLRHGGGWKLSYACMALLPPYPFGMRGAPIER